MAGASLVIRLLLALAIIAAVWWWYASYERRGRGNHVMEGV